MLIEGCVVYGQVCMCVMCTECARKVRAEKGEGGEGRRGGVSVCVYV